MNSEKSVYQDRDISDPGDNGSSHRQMGSISDISSVHDGEPKAGSLSHVTLYLIITGIFALPLLITSLFIVATHPLSPMLLLFAVLFGGLTIVVTARISRNRKLLFHIKASVDSGEFISHSAQEQGSLEDIGRSLHEALLSNR